MVLGPLPPKICLPPLKPTQGAATPCRCLVSPWWDRSRVSCDGCSICSSTLWWLFSLGRPWRLRVLCAGLRRSVSRVSMDRLLKVMRALNILNALLLAVACFFSFTILSNITGFFLVGGWVAGWLGALTVWVCGCVGVWVCGGELLLHTCTPALVQMD